MSKGQGFGFGLGKMKELADAFKKAQQVQENAKTLQIELEQVVNTFLTFASRCDTLIGCIDCETVKNRLKPQISYSLQGVAEADYTVSDIEYRADGTTATVWERKKVLGVLNLSLLGKHNLSNAIASVAVGRLLKLDFATIAQSLVNFVGASRRFEKRGEAGGVTFIDDYAHHPSEITVTYQSSLKEVANFLLANLRPGDIALFLGAGNLNQIIPSAIASIGQISV
jgi:UDP-N-acetylmuramate--alanine ligase